LAKKKSAQLQTQAAQNGKARRRLFFGAGAPAL